MTCTTQPMEDEESMPARPKKKPNCLRLAVRFRRWCRATHPRSSLWRCYWSKWTASEIAIVLANHKCGTLDEVVTLFTAITADTLKALAGPACRTDPVVQASVAA